MKRSAHGSTRRMAESGNWPACCSADAGGSGATGRDVDVHLSNTPLVSKAIRSTDRGKEGPGMRPGWDTSAMALIGRPDDRRGASAPGAHERQPSAVAMMLIALARAREMSMVWDALLRDPASPSLRTMMTAMAELSFDLERQNHRTRRADRAARTRRIRGCRRDLVAVASTRIVGAAPLRRQPRSTRSGRPPSPFVT